MTETTPDTLLRMIVFEDIAKLFSNNIRLTGTDDILIVVLGV